MSSAGHVLDMIRRQKANRELQKRARNRYSVKKGNGTNKSVFSEFNIEKFGGKTDQEIEENISRVRERIKNNKRTALIKTIITSILLFTTLYLIFNMFKLTITLECR